MSRNRGVTTSRACFARWWADPAVSTAEIGRRLGITGQGARWRAKAYGLPARKGGCPWTIQPGDPLFREMWDAGVSPFEIGRHYGCGVHSVNNLARVLGLKRRINRWTSITVAQFRDARAADLMAQRMARVAAAEQAAVAQAWGGVA